MACRQQAEAGGAALTSAPGGGPIRINPTRCVSLQRPAVPCRACARVCPTEAVRLGERSLAIALERCVGCGRCAAACPTEALEIAGFAELPVTTLRVECGRVPAGARQPGTAVVPCLGGVRPAALRAHLARDASRTVVVVDRGWCAQCPAGGCAQPWDETVRGIRAELERLGGSYRLEVVREPLPIEMAGPPPAPPREDRRGFGRRAFLLAPGRGQLRRANAQLEVSSAGSPRRIDPAALRARARVLASLAGSAQAPAGLFPDLIVADSCCDRRLCAASCPTGALTHDGDEEESRLRFDPEICTGCGLCVRLCPSGALTLLPSGGAGSVAAHVLRRRRLVRCAACGQSFWPPARGGLCPSCANDQDLMRSVHRLLRGADGTAPTTQEI